jgi:hypothetical protein
MSDDTDELVKRFKQAVAALSTPPLAKGGGVDRVGDVGKAFSALAEHPAGRRDLQPSRAPGRVASGTECRHRTEFSITAASTGLMWFATPTATSGPTASRETAGLSKYGHATAGRARSLGY